MAFAPVKHLSFLCLVICLSSGAIGAKEPTALQRSLDDISKTEFEKTSITGITVAVGKEDRIVFAQGYGKTDFRNEAPVLPTTKMRVGSISKVMTAALLAKLYEEGKLDLDAPIQRYAPYFPEKKWPVSLRQLSTHTGGIRHYKNLEFMNAKHFKTVRDGMVFFINDPLLFEPGTRVSYSTYGWSLISAALEKAGGAPFLRLMDDKVFTPIGMTDTVAEDTEKNIPYLSGFQLVYEGMLITAPFVDNSNKWAGGGFVATAKDVAIFGLAHTHPGFLKQKTLALLFHEQTLKDATPTGYGIGWMMADTLRKRLADKPYAAAIEGAIHDDLVWHSGGSMGGVALLLVDPEAHVAVALMANHGDGYPLLQKLGLTLLKRTLEEDQTIIQ